MAATGLPDSVKDWVKCIVIAAAVYTGAVFTYHLIAGTTPDANATPSSLRRGAAARKGEKNNKSGYLPPGKVLFEPTLNWQPVRDDHVLPPGLHIRVNVTTGVKEAKLILPKSATVLPNVGSAIGSTPLVDLSRLIAGTPGIAAGSTVLAKLDYLNPGSSKKDRIAHQIVQDAEAAGQLTPGSGQTVVELTSGNTGTGLSIVCAVNGYKFVAVMSKGNSPERARMMRALGAEVVLVDQQPGSVAGQVSGADLELVEEVAQQIVRERGAFRADQFEKEGNFRAHYLGTGPEIWAATREQGTPMDGWVDFLGSGGTFAGAAQYFYDQDPSVRSFVVEPASAAVVRAAMQGPAGDGAADDSDGSHVIQGGGYSMASLSMLGMLKPSPEDLIADYLTVTDDEATQTARRLASEEGIFGGFSGGANVAAAIQVLQSPWAQVNGGKTVCAVICDSGMKYLSTDLWE